METTNAVLTLLVFYFLILSSQFSILNYAYYLLVIYCLIVVFATDFRYRVIPDEIILILILTGLVFLVFRSSLAVEHLLSAASAPAFFFFLFLITRGKGMGLGDVKLVAALGLLLGFPGTVIAIAVAFLTGAITGVILILSGSKKLKSQIAFGPFLALGAMSVLFFENWIFATLLLIFK